MNQRYAQRFENRVAIVTGTGLILLYQNSTGRWQTWAYIWALYPVFLGLGLMFLGRRTDDEGTRRAGRGFVTWGAHLQSSTE